MREPEHALHAVQSDAVRDYVEFWPAGTGGPGRVRGTAGGGANYLQ